jgi:hypothetical protein
MEDRYKIILGSALGIAVIYLAYNEFLKKKSETLNTVGELVTSQIEPPNQDTYYNRRRNKPFLP